MRKWRQGLINSSPLYAQGSKKKKKTNFYIWFFWLLGYVNFRIPHRRNSVWFQGEIPGDTIWFYSTATTNFLPYCYYEFSHPLATMNNELGGKWEGEGRESRRAQHFPRSRKNQWEEGWSPDEWSVEGSPWASHQEEPGWAHWACPKD